jgi:hypothetical protein
VNNVKIPFQAKLITEPKDDIYNSKYHQYSEGHKTNRARQLSKMLGPDPSWRLVAEVWSLAEFSRWLMLERLKRASPPSILFGFYGRTG